MTAVLEAPSVTTVNSMLSATIAEVVAEARGIGYEQLDAIVSENAARLFGWSG